MSEKNRIGVELGLDGVRKVEGQLGDIADAAKAAAAETGKAFEKAADHAATASGEAAQEAETAAARIKKAFAAVATTIKRALATVTRSVAGVSMSITRGLGRAGVAGGRALVSGIRSGIERSKGIIQTALAGVTAGAAGVFAGAVESSTFAELQARFARAGGTTLGNFGELSSIARQFGAADDELLGAFSTFSDKLAEASRGEGAKAFFDELGISATDASGKVRDTGEVFRELTQALRNVRSDSKRANFANELLGGDAEKLASVLALSTEELNARSRLAREAGTVVSPEQLARTRQFLDSWRGLQETFRGLMLTVADRVYPGLARLFSDVSRWIRENRKAIADWISGGFNRLVSVVRDLFNAFAGNRGAVSHGWVLALADILTAVGRAASGVLGLFEKFGPTIGESLGRGVIALRDFAAAFLVAFGSGGTALDLFGTNAKSDTSNRIVENIDKNGVQKTQARFAKKGERVLPFVVDQQTAGAAVGFAGALSSMQDRLSGVFGGVKTAIVNDVIPAIKLLYAALRGDELARQTVVDAMIDGVDRLLGRQGLVYDFWLLVTGRGDKIPEGSRVDTIRDSLKRFYDEAKPWAEGFWAVITGMGQTLPESNPVSQLLKKVDDLKEKAQSAYDTVDKLLTGRGISAGEVVGAAAAASTGSRVASAVAAAANTPAGRIAALGAAIATLFVPVPDSWLEGFSRFSEIAGDLRAKFSGISSDIKTGLIDGWKSFADAFPGLADKIAAAAEKIAAPFRAMARIIRFIADPMGAANEGGALKDIYTPITPDMPADQRNNILTQRQIAMDLDPSLVKAFGVSGAENLFISGKVAPIVKKTGLPQQIPVPKMSIPSLPARAEARAPSSDMRPVVLNIGGNSSGTLYGPHDVVNALTRSIERSNRLAVAGK